MSPTPHCTARRSIGDASFPTPARPCSRWILAIPSADAILVGSDTIAAFCREAKVLAGRGTIIEIDILADLARLRQLDLTVLDD